MQFVGLEHVPASQRIFCVGRNYADHAKELGNAMPAAGSTPIIFMKPITSLVKGASLCLPRGVGAVHHEMELVVVLGKGGSGITESAALDHVEGATLGLDLTLRDEQKRLKDAGSPWELAKAFDDAAALGDFVPVDDLDLRALEMRCTVDGALRQHGNTKDMLFPVATIVAFLSTRWHLLPGDLIYTGTPAGVGPLELGQKIEISSAPIGTFSWICV
ncbi:MAG TPA: fumarylacetoacetate hydrolase family protein [Gammaproteobacteria bacterium]|jgi:2-keto-4-pentenoate hydratase/2-oxohepta-3-ene-1,7-dioic acid hydratase in catechol pathway|nr:fumarylacetoacetate hydrolase family protein [Gammaproteobacteria bacterium]